MKIKNSFFDVFKGYLVLEGIHVNYIKNEKKHSLLPVVGTITNGEFMLLLCKMALLT